MSKKARNIIRRLEEESQRLKEENQRLKEENAYLKFELQELKNKLYKRKSRKPPPPPDSGETPILKKKGGLFGHIGWFRRKPKRVDRVEEVRLDKGYSFTQTRDNTLPKTQVLLQKLQKNSYRHRRERTSEKLHRTEG